MEAIPNPEQTAEVGPQPAVSGRRTIVPGIPIRPFWTFVGGWSVLCGVLASNPLRWNGQLFLGLAIVFLLVTLAWAGLWALATGSDWPPSLAGGRGGAVLPVLPFTHPHSPAGRLGRGLSVLVGWWRGTFWPAASSITVGCLVAALLAAVLSLLLPPSLRWLHLAVAGLVALGITQRHRGHTSLAGQSLLFVGLAWTAGNLAFARFHWPSAALALLFSLAVWGVLRVAQGQLAWLWLLHGAQVIVAVLLLTLKQPLAAGGIGILLLGQIVSHLTLRFGDDPRRVAQRTWPWLAAAMLVAAWAIP
jgi:hypothetical protein